MCLVDVPDMLKHQLKKKLTFKKYRYGDNSKVDVRVWEERGNRFFIPRAFLAQSGISCPIVDRSSKGNKLKGKCKLNLNFRGLDQDGFVQALVDGAKKNKLGGYGIAPCATGKTAMGIELCRRLGRSALIVVNMTHQLHHWRDEALKHFDFTKKKVGIYQQKRRPTGNQFPLTIASLRSVAKERRKEFFDSYGTVVFDECHHMPANGLLCVLSHVRARYIFGVSASFHRTDGIGQDFFQYVIGPVLAKLDPPMAKTGVAKMVNLRLMYKYCWGDKRTSVAKNLAANKFRNKAVVSEIGKCYSEGRQIFVFSDLVNHLQDLIKQCANNGIPVDELGLVDGSTPYGSRPELEGRAVTFLTYRMGTEALNVVHKDTIICATPPVSNVEQLRGRVAREEKGLVKKPPMIVEFVDTNWDKLRKACLRRALVWRKFGLVNVEVEHGDY
jgi:superfamily II DNA or RNA helicase